MVNGRNGQTISEFLMITLLLIVVGFMLDFLVRGHLIPAQMLAGQKIGQDK